METRKGTFVFETPPIQLKECPDGGVENTNDSCVWWADT